MPSMALDRRATSVLTCVCSPKRPTPRRTRPTPTSLVHAAGPPRNRSSVRSSFTRALSTSPRGRQVGGTKGMAEPRRRCSRWRATPSISLSPPRQRRSSARSTRTATTCSRSFERFALRVKDPKAIVPAAVRAVTTFAHDGLELVVRRHRTRPRPRGRPERRDGVTVAVGVCRPAGPATARERPVPVDGRGVHTLSAPVLADRPRAAHAVLPRGVPPRSGRADAVGTCRWPPARAAARRIRRRRRRFPCVASGCTRPARPRLRTSAPALAPRRPPAFATRLEHLVRASVPLTDQPEIIGQTPEGFVVDWPPVGGTLDGSAFHADGHPRRPARVDDHRRTARGSSRRA